MLSEERHNEAPLSDAMLEYALETGNYLPMMAYIRCDLFKGQPLSNSFLLHSENPVQREAWRPRNHGELILPGLNLVPTTWDILDSLACARGVPRQRLHVLLAAKSPFTSTSS